MSYVSNMYLCGCVFVSLCVCQSLECKCAFVLFTRVFVAPGNKASEHIKEVVDVLFPGLRHHG